MRCQLPGCGTASLTSPQRYLLRNASDSNLVLVFLSSLRRRFVSRLLCVLLGHVFALPRRAVKTRAFPVVNTCLGVNPHLAMAAARRGRVSRFLGTARCRR